MHSRTLGLTTKNEYQNIKKRFGYRTFRTEAKVCLKSSHQIEFYIPGTLGVGMGAEGLGAKLMMRLQFGLKKSYKMSMYQLIISYFKNFHV